MELGSYCAQYGYEKILPSLAKREKHYKSNKKKSYKKKYSIEHSFELVLP